MEAYTYFYICKTQRIHKIINSGKKYRKFIKLNDDLYLSLKVALFNSIYVHSKLLLNNLLIFKSFVYF